MTANDGKVFDLAIIGGGIAGAGIARDAALRGLSVVLFEKNTFGSGTSSKSSRLIHGGIRYLDLAWIAFQHGEWAEAWKNFRFVFLSLRESYILQRIAPQLVRPVSLLIPIYKSPGQNRWAVFSGTFLYSLLARFTGGKKLPAILWNPKAVLEKIPPLNPENLTGGVMIWDHTTDDRSLVRATLESAAKNGAQTYEHAEFLRAERQKDGYQMEVKRGDKRESFRARKIVNASGAWVDEVRKRAGEQNGDYIVPVAGCHIHLKKFLDQSLVLQAEDKRIFFVIHQGDISRIGTTERLHKDPDHVEATPEEITYLLASLRRYFPKLNFEEKDVLSSDAGIRPLSKPEKPKSPHDISREHEIRVGPEGIFHVLGVKLTDHRRAAEKTVDRLAAELGSPAIKSQTAKLLL